ncbi:MAG: hypothetical protein KGJ80_03300 [Chloroflexota bacterium]|nr:hypothetical protein [Chloroflexota bacterium]
MPTRIQIADGDQMTTIWLKSILERAGYVIDTVNRMECFPRKRCHIDVHRYSADVPAARQKQGELTHG